MIKSPEKIVNSKTGNFKKKKKKSKKQILKEQQQRGWEVGKRKSRAMKLLLLQSFFSVNIELWKWKLKMDAIFIEAGERRMDDLFFIPKMKLFKNMVNKIYPVLRQLNCLIFNWCKSSEGWRVNSSVIENVSILNSICEYRGNLEGFWKVLHLRHFMHDKEILLHSWR